MSHTLRCTRHRLDNCRRCPRPKRGQRLTSNSTWRFYDDGGAVTDYMIGSLISEVVEAVRESGSSWAPSSDSGSYGGGDFGGSSSYDSGSSSSGSDSSW
jgi:hypothetical protein